MCINMLAEMPQPMCQRQQILSESTQRSKRSVMRLLVLLLAIVAGDVVEAELINVL